MLCVHIPCFMGIHISSDLLEMATGKQQGKARRRKYVNQVLVQYCSLGNSPETHRNIHTDRCILISYANRTHTKTEACLKVSQVQSNQNRVSLGHDYAYQQTFMECLLCVITLPFIYLLLIIFGWLP